MKYNSVAGGDDLYLRMVPVNILNSPQGVVLQLVSWAK
jgi:hypothetical protein